MTRMTALRNCMYAGVRHQAGDEFDIPKPRDVALFKAAKLAKDAPAKPMVTRPVKLPLVAKVVAPTVDVSPHVAVDEYAAKVAQVFDAFKADDEEKPKRKYTRKDMEAEG